MAYDKELPGCFGERDLLFANHPLDADRAFDWLTSLRKRDATWTEASNQFRDYLTERRATTDHITKQLRVAARRIKPWLYGD